MSARAVLLASIVLTACGAAEVPVASVPEAPVESATSAGPPELAEGVVALEATCDESAEERCDGLDSDCDGHIDEGCEGAARAPMQVAVAWTGRARVDLFVAGPGEPVVVRALECADADALSVGRASLESLPPGRYRVELAHVDACGAEGPVTASVSLSFGGSSLGVFNRALATNERAPVLELTLR